VVLVLCTTGTSRLPVLPDASEELASGPVALPDRPPRPRASPPPVRGLRVPCSRAGPPRDAPGVTRGGTNDVVPPRRRGPLGVPSHLPSCPRLRVARGATRRGPTALLALRATPALSLSPCHQGVLRPSCAHEGRMPGGHPVGSRSLEVLHVT